MFCTNGSPKMSLSHREHNGRKTRLLKTLRKRKRVTRLVSCVPLAQGLPWTICLPAAAMTSESTVPGLIQGPPSLTLPCVSRVPHSSYCFPEALAPPTVSPVLPSPMNSFRLFLSHSSVFHLVMLLTHPPRSVSPIPEAQITGRLLGQSLSPRLTPELPWILLPFLLMDEPLADSSATSLPRLPLLPPPPPLPSLPGPSHSYSSCLAFCSSALPDYWAPAFPGTSRMIILKSSEIVTPMLNYTGQMEAALHGRISAGLCSGSVGGRSSCHLSFSALPPWLCRTHPLPTQGLPAPHLQSSLCAGSSLGCFPELSWSWVPENTPQNRAQ